MDIDGKLIQRQHALGLAGCISDSLAMGNRGCTCLPPDVAERESSIALPVDWPSPLRALVAQYAIDERDLVLRYKTLASPELSECVAQCLDWIWMRCTLQVRIEVLERALIHNDSIVLDSMMSHRTTWVNNVSEAQRVLYLLVSNLRKPHFPLLDHWMQCHAKFCNAEVVLAVLQRLFATKIAFTQLQQRVLWLCKWHALDANAVAVAAVAGFARRPPTIVYRTSDGYGY